MKMRILYVILSVLGVVGALCGITQFIMAIRFLEFGRVIFYFIITALLAELAVFSILKLREGKK